MGELWRRTVTDDWIFPHAANDDVVIVETLDRDRTLIALDAASGRRRWRLGVKGTHTGLAVRLVDGGLYVGDGSDRVIALDAATGTERWSTSIGEGWEEYATGLHVNDGLVAWSSKKGAGCLDAADGAVVWARDHPAIDGFKEIEVGTKIEVGGGIVVFFACYRAEYWYDREPMPATVYRSTAVDLATDEILWQRESGFMSSGLFGGDGLHCVDRRTGAVRWHAPARLEWPGTVVMAGGNFVTTVKEGVAAFDMATGAEAWQLDEKPPVHYWELWPVGPDRLLLALAQRPPPRRPAARRERRRRAGPPARA